MARRFAAARGTSTRAGLVELWRSREDDFQVLLPGAVTSSAARERIDSAVKTIASYEQRTPEEVTASIRAIGFDRVLSRVPDSMVVDDSVHLVNAASFITYIRELLAATYTTQMQPAAFYQRVRPEAVRYADRCRFGHTFRGSFGFTVEIAPDRECLSPAAADGGSAADRAQGHRAACARCCRGRQSGRYAKRRTAC